MSQVRSTDHSQFENEITTAIKFFNAYPGPYIHSEGVPTGLGASQDKGGPHRTGA